MMVPENELLNTARYTNRTDDFNEGDTITMHIHNSLWKIFWHWLTRKPLARTEEFIITSITSETSMEVEEVE